RGARGGNVLRTDLDLTACYDEKLKLERVVRTVWLAAKQYVVVADQLAGQVESVKYHWHGHPNAPWWADEHWARVCLGEKVCHIGSPQVAMKDVSIDRLKGSRGQLTLM